MRLKNAKPMINSKQKSSFKIVNKKLYKSQGNEDISKKK